MNIKDIFFGVAVVAILGVAIFGITKDPVVVNVTSEDGVTRVENVGAVSSPDVYSYMNVHGWFAQGGGSNSIDPVDGTYSLTFSDMNDYNWITFDASTTQAALTVTLPATTSFPLANEAGAYRSWVIENPFTAAATTTTVAAGTGVDLQEPDGQNVVIGINNFAWLTCVRQPNTDVSCRVDESIPAD